MEICSWVPSRSIGTVSDRWWSSGIMPHSSSIDIIMSSEGREGRSEGRGTRDEERGKVVALRWVDSPSKPSLTELYFNY